MRRSFVILFLVTAIVCLKRGYDIISADDSLTSFSKGLLSEIANEVIAIPLQVKNNIRKDSIRSIQKEGDNIFLISNQTIYRFNKSGEFICQVTDPDIIHVAGYVIDQLNRKLIVLGNVDDIFYYSFNGLLLEKKKLKSNLSQSRILSARMHNNTIWTTEENTVKSESNDSLLLEKQVIRYDSSFNKLKSYKVKTVNRGNQDQLSVCLNPEISVIKDTGKVYIYSQSVNSDLLLKDSLLIKQRNDFYSAKTDDSIWVYPLKLGNRYWISSYTNGYDKTENYTFCFDQYSNKSWELKDGFEDDFYGTGQISELKTMDIYGNDYYYISSIKETSIHQSQEESLVLFVVKLKA